MTSEELKSEIFGLEERIKINIEDIEVNKKTLEALDIVRKKAKAFNLIYPYIDELDDTCHIIHHHIFIKEQSNTLKEAIDIEQGEE